MVSAEILEQNTAMRLANKLGCSVIVLTARSGVEALVNLLDEGADDVLRKPFGLEELEKVEDSIKARKDRSARKSRGWSLEVIYFRQVTLSEKP